MLANTVLCRAHNSTKTYNKLALLIPFARIACSLTIIFFSTTAFSQRNENCSATTDSVIYQTPPIFQEQEVINISADQTRSDSQGNTAFQGHVVIEKHELRITADNASYNANTENINIDGNVHVDSINMAIDADLGRLSKEKQSSFFEGVKFQIGKKNMRGKASSINAGIENKTEL
ncbi:MAG: hypothetical protein OEY66_09535, partial [Gammaproteobacteria bacterium]|nr:hypothetical protein [Gammaproteobacteria bacterium]